MSKNKEIGLEVFLELVSSDAECAVSQVYDSYRSAFLMFARKISKNKELAIDAFQEAVIALYENAVRGKIESNGTSLKTYLFAIGKNKLITILNKEGKYVSMPEYERSMSVDDSGEDVQLPAEIEIAYQRLGDTCQKIIELYYYRRYSIEAIMQSLDLTSENSVKANKSRCIKQLRNLVAKSKVRK